jgi:outer membrane immunogenic protein
MRTLTHIAAISLFTAGAATAADLPVRAPAPVAPAPVVASWTGCYIGAGWGYGMFNQDHQTFTLGGIASGPEATTGGRGWLGTVQVGCDYQAGSQFVIGIFADYDWANIKGDHLLSINGLPYGGEEKLKSSWAVGGRLGYLPFAQTQMMVFVSGGYSQAHFSGFNLSLIPSISAAFHVDNANRSGWFIGSGYEYAFLFFPGLTWKTEYRFADYGKERDTIFLINTTTPGVYTDSQKFVHTVRSELVWRFNFGGTRFY